MAWKLAKPRPPGYKQVVPDSDAWDDMHVDIHVPPSDFLDDEEMQHGFKWTCCGEQGDAEGCMVSKDVPVQDQKRMKRTPYG